MKVVYDDESSGSATEDGLIGPGTPPDRDAQGDPRAFWFEHENGHVDDSGAPPALASRAASPPHASSSSGVDVDAASSIAAPVEPPPFPNAAPRSPPRGGGARGRNEIRVDFGGGHILKNQASASLDAHCRTCGCAVNRRFLPFPRAKSAKKLAQGRPMGLLTSWLRYGCSGRADEHRAFLNELTHGLRLAARHAALAHPECAVLFACERAENVGDMDGEPIETP